MAPEQSALIQQRRPDYDDDPEEALTDALAALDLIDYTADEDMKYEELVLFWQTRLL